ncbi:Crp/Fnr family transcriptional regulator [Leptospira sp. 96542]|nr:Crp/Fnr family transcriptional regulator [Leptospira sp. 96542]
MSQTLTNNDKKILIFQRFTDFGKKVKLRKKEFFAKQGVEIDSVGYVKKGGFKLVYQNKKKEWIKSFLFEGSLLGSIPSILDHKPSTYSIIAIESSEVLVLPAKDFKATFKMDTLYKDFLIQLLTSLYLKKEKRVSDFLLFEANERYKVFLEEFSENSSRISQIDQAAYLGITNVALSRIKKKFFADNPQ